MAFPYIKPDVLRFFQERRNELRILIDSGAFTAWKSGKTISVDDYCKFIESLPVKPWRYFTLDVVGDPKGTLAISNSAAVLWRISTRPHRECDSFLNKNSSSIAEREEVSS
jgi:hypothetical protein